MLAARPTTPRAVARVPAAAAARGRLRAAGPAVGAAARAMGPDDGRHDRRDARPRAAGRTVAPPRSVPDQRPPDVCAEGGAARVAGTEFDVLRHLQAQALPAVAAVGLAEAPDRDIGHPRDRVPRVLDPVPPPAHALPAGARARTATGCSTRWPGCWSISTGRACSGAIARSPTPCSVGTATRSRPSSWTPRRARSTRRCPTASAATTSTSSSRTSPSASPTSGRCRAARAPSDDAVEAAETVRARYTRCGTSCTSSPVLSAGRSPGRAGPDPPAQRARLRGRRDLARTDRARRGRCPPQGRRRQPALPRPRAGTTDRDPGASRDRPSSCSTTCTSTGPGSSTTSGARSPRARRPTAGCHDVLEPGLRELVPAIGAGRDPLQAYCDVLEQKWILSEMAGTDVGPRRRRWTPTSASARRPRRRTPATDEAGIALDIDWSGAWETTPRRGTRTTEPATA